MDIDKVLVIDIEADGLLREATKIHVVSMSYQKESGEWVTTSTNDYDKMRELFTNPNHTIVGHNFICYDIPVLERILDIKFECNVIDSLGLSWYLFPMRMLHGLASWGVDLGVLKVVVEDDQWKGLSEEDLLLPPAQLKQRQDEHYALMKERCEEDTKINVLLWYKILEKLKLLYGDSDKIVNVINYLNFKMTCLRVQEANPLTIDVELCEKNIAFLDSIIEEKVTELMGTMPKVPVKQIKTRPKKPFKKDGSLSATGKAWFDMLEKLDLPDDYDKEVQVISSYKEPNPTSSAQVKDYLFSLGWKPKIFKDGANGKVPQLRDDEKMLCSSIQDIIKVVPELESLQGLSVAQHRSAILKGFLSSLINENQVIAGASKFARTLRLAHRKPCVNLPSTSSQYGELIRSVIIAPDGYLLCGSDVSSLENKTLQNAIYHLDKAYVEEMNFPGFDSHLKLGRMAKLITDQEAEFYAWFKKYDKVERDSNTEAMSNLVAKGLENDLICDLVVQDSATMHKLFDAISEKRSVSKTSNYALTYKCGIAKLAESAKVPMSQAKSIHKAYWDMNWAVETYAESLNTKTVEGEEWIFNPASNLWLYLSSDHIKFSACNQNAGVKIFDLWLYFVMQKGIEPSFQAHDEILFKVRPEDKADVERKLKESMQQVNDALGLLVPIEIDVQFGLNYGDVH